MQQTILHASCVALDGKGCLIIGASGAGKSSLALQLMAYGAGLVADDRTIITKENGSLFASCPDTISGMIEARKVGILRATPCGKCRLSFVVDLDKIETDRLPPAREHIILAHSLPVIHQTQEAYFPAAILQMLRGCDDY